MIGKSKAFETALQVMDNLKEIHHDWSQIMSFSTSGKKGYLTRVKEHYLLIVKADPEGAAKLLAMYELKNSGDLKQLPEH